MKPLWPNWLSMAVAVFVCDSYGEQPANVVPSTNSPVRLKNLADLKFKQDSFTFVRIKYAVQRRSSGVWSVDYPDADLNFSARFEKETGLKTDPKGHVLELTDPRLKEYPFIYIVEGGSFQLSDDEAHALREYLTNGGFLMVDDFWGEAEWHSLAMQMKRVFPDREPIELDVKHPIFHSWYDIKAKPQVPNVALGTASQFHGRTWEREDSKEPHYRALINDNGRVMAIVCHNTDLGDGWEREGDNEYYFKEFSVKKAYPMGINIVVYALTN